MSHTPDRATVTPKSSGPSRRSIPRQTEITDTRRYIVMVAMALGGFGIGVTEFVSMGLLSDIAADFQISEDSAGHIITAYAMGVVIGAPLIAALTGSVPRRRLLLILMAAFTVGNALTVFAGVYANSYAVLVASRFLAALPHGAFFSVSGLAAASMAPKGQRGRALAFVGLGLPFATVLGVPVAQALGHAVGWQSAYVLVSAIGLATLAALWFLMPHMTRMAPTSPLTELGALGRGQVWLSLAIGSVGFGGMFAVYTYISWTMTQRAGLDPSHMWFVLMVYGLGMVAGTWVGGRLSDWNLEYGILVALGAICASLLAFYVASTNAVAATVCFGLIGMAGSTLIPSLQIRLMDVAGEAQTLAAALNHSALNIANAAGASMGGAVIAAGYSYSAPALAGAGLALIAVVLWYVAFALRRRDMAR
ncbi:MULTISPECIES: MFS transporter [unclassified Corynebacterium]|uniref:MFS transporter n=1 Tax=unclassified Corynebacterium TaxID=2624378 RepID=UPI0029CA84E7|nr:MULTISPECIES: MFS transporter [unclassified Corynebacterium]WPF66271.1 MFS transporter [Corynebacterium sp. 22KM0430]WPF68761.1 MFS transporter [Corynebacterium sp. 21KM1197]